MIEHAGFRPYELPLRHAWNSARGGFAQRCGWLVWVEADGLTGYGDCAPLPAAGTETHEAAGAALARLTASLPGQDVATGLAALDADGDTSETPAARFALECALTDLASRHQGLSLRDWLAPDSAPIARISVNAMLGPLGTVRGEDLVTRHAQGFRVLKLKVGVETPASDLDALIALMRPPLVGAGLDVGLRLDANGAWSFDQARRLIERLIQLRLPIESIEEPLTEPTPERLAALQALAPFPLALDESLPARFATHDTSRLAGTDPAQFGVRRLVLKPAALGGLRRTLELARRAQAAGIEVVVTSLVESAAGLWPTAQLAGAIASPIPQGLATADWLAADLGRAPRPCAGRLELPDRSGSGFVPWPPASTDSGTQEARAVEPVSGDDPNPGANPSLG
ncbi:o-succinylbenzoate synthase [Allochromatium vinosum]|uniref:o-succinylbenzoate synthase n=1 Tax=Allochromatium vinosum (strain ATCC 17899 / DSM 180 / NBRC 103801 / NCIMB 10441 / D) TaxID=572477 RepID=D3RPJ0_ALLVD|nr:o-succinylbenzoate synthase [Allochromatium vinosum]ADC61572.1 Mandelate racemase/muconate lactonizing protein [Allochromatium vinosum DSM 180]